MAYSTVAPVAGTVEGLVVRVSSIVSTVLLLLWAILAAMMVRLSMVRPSSSLIQASASFRAGVTAAVASLLVATGLIGTSLFAASIEAQENGCTVTSLDDSGEGTLRAHVMNPSCTIIDFAPAILPGTITLGSQLTIDIDRNLVIDGPGAEVLEVSGNGIVRVLEVHPGVTATISRLRIADGSAIHGAGIFNQGTLTLSEVIVVDNVSTTGMGGGIRNHGTMEITGSVISNNSAPAAGGIFNSLGSLIVSGGTWISENTATLSGGLGGGIYNSGGSLSVTQSDVVDNSAGNGGGVVNRGASGTVTINESSVFGNDASIAGGGVDHAGGGTITITNSEIFGNSAGNRGGGIATFGSGSLTLSDSLVAENTADLGAGVWNEGSSSATVTDSTISGNHATNHGGGISNHGTLTLTGSTVANNSAENFGGGINNSPFQGPGSLIVVDSTISGNDGGLSGGAIRNSDGAVTITDSIIVGNIARFVGGGLENVGGDASMTVTGSTITANSATDGGTGAGIHNMLGMVSVVNSTLSENAAGFGGGGIWNQGTLTVASSTLTENAAAGDGGGGGIANRSDGTLTLSGSTIADNSAATGAPGIDNAGTVTVQGPPSLVDGYVQVGGTTVLVGGDLASEVTVAIQGGTLAGTGSLTADVVISGGAIAPGLSAGTIAITGDYAQAADGAYEVQIGGVTPGTEHDELVISGSASLDGTLDISLLDSFMPGPGARFTIMTFASSTGAFSDVNGTEIGEGLELEVEYNEDSVVLVVVGEAIDSHTLTVDVVGEGTVSADPEQAEYEHGTVVELSATADAGWTFSHWEGDASGTNPVTSVTMDGDLVVTAVFASLSHTLAVDVVGEGTVSADPEQAEYEHGTVVELSATADAGWTFSHWEGDASGTNPVTSVTMDGDKAITAVFAEVTHEVVDTIDRILGRFDEAFDDGRLDRVKERLRAVKERILKLPRRARAPSEMTGGQMVGLCGEVDAIYQDLLSDSDGDTESELVDSMRALMHELGCS